MKDKRIDALYSDIEAAKSRDKMRYCGIKKLDGDIVLVYTDENYRLDRGF